jgi:hypothetical protein
MMALMHNGSSSSSSSSKQGLGKSVYSSPNLIMQGRTF